MSYLVILNFECVDMNLCYYLVYGWDPGESFLGVRVFLHLLSAGINFGYN